MLREVIEEVGFYKADHSSIPAQASELTLAVSPGDSPPKLGVMTDDAENLAFRISPHHSGTISDILAQRGAHSRWILRGWRGG